MVKLSERLSHLADLVTAGNVLADIGTDHGYIPIYLVEKQKIPRAFAMDIGEGPLRRAQEHIKACGLGEYITLRCSDGLLALAADEADSIMIAGMGGGLILQILDQGRDTARNARELILQPQSEIDKVRSYLDSRGYLIDAEDMVYEDGKYYPMIHAAYCKERKDYLSSQEEKAIFYRYGEKLLKMKHVVLHQYLLFLKEQYEAILIGLCRQDETPAILVRMHEVREEISYIEQALLYWKDGA